MAAWYERLQRHDELLAEYAALPASASDDERLQVLRSAEVLVSSTVGSGLSPAAHLVSLAPKRAAFVARRDQLDGLVTTPRPTLADLMSDALAAADVAAFDPEPLDLTDEIAAIDRFRAELPGRVEQLAIEVASRVAAAGDALAAHDAAPAGARADLVRDGLRAVFGEDLVAVPTITLQRRPRPSWRWPGTTRPPVD